MKALRPAAHATDDPSRIGGRYRIDRVLAEGGMGAVYRATDERTGTPIALKRLLATDQAHMVALFEREYRTLVGLSHPRIVRAYDYGVDARGPYYTMELATGRDLFEVAPLSATDACRHLRDVATCLALLHTRRLLHRDITPRNVRVGDDGECKLLDFGALMSFGIPERAVGTPPCIPPEALRRTPIDQRADIFSLGALMYWTLTRKHAYPAKRIDDLKEMWRKRPAPPSQLASGISPELDKLVLSMLSLEPLARPSTMAEVVDRLTLIGGLPPEDPVTQRRLAESYLVQGDFVGRKAELTQLGEDLAALDEGQGSTTLVTGPSGVGRTRLLAEVGVQAQLLGVPTLHVDASAHRQHNGTAVAIVQRLIDVSPAALREATAHAASLSEVDAELSRRLGKAASAPVATVSGDWRARVQELLHAIVTAACTDGRLLLLVDNIDEADDGSLSLLAGLLRLSEQAPLAMVLSLREGGQDQISISWRMLQHRSKILALAPLSNDETLALCRSLFGDVPNLARFSQWLSELTSGVPLHSMELLRRLHAGSVIRYLDGIWVLPAERPASWPSDALDALIADRLSEVSEPALRLAEALAVQRGSLARERCRELAQVEGPQPLLLIDELVRADVLQDTLKGYRFSHGVLRDVLLTRMPAERRRALHLACAEHALSHTQDVDPLHVRVEAGWHFLKAGEESRGADVLAGVAYDTVGVRVAFADLQVAAPALEAALAVYTRQNRSIYERTPLMTALAQAGYYEDRVWGERYGDAALAAIEEVSGLRTAKKLRPWLGKTLSLVAGIGSAYVRFMFSRARRKRYGFHEVLIQLFGVVTTMTGAASIALDVPRAARIAKSLDPFKHLPERMTPVGIAQFCAALKEIGRENQAVALAAWTTLIKRFEDPRYYPTLPDRARPLYVGGLWFARGVFEAFRDGKGALRAADELDKLGLKLYRMIGSALRVLHHANRGELELARRHREQVDLHAIQIGSAWQVELWEPAAMILVYASIGDLVECRRNADRLHTLAKSVPSLAQYATLATLVLQVVRLDALPEHEREGYLATASSILDKAKPRSFIGWSAAVAFTAHALNESGRHQEARELCLRGLAQLTPEDRPFVALFLAIELELVLSEVACGDATSARTRIDELLTYHRGSDNPLTRGRLHETCARVCASEQDWPSFRHHLEETRNWYRSTGTAALVARLAPIEALDPTRSALADSYRPVPSANETARFAPVRGPSDRPSARARAEANRPLTSTVASVNDADEERSRIRSPLPK